MQLIGLTITSRNGIAITPQLMGFDVSDIVSPIQYNSLTSESYFVARALKGSVNDSRNLGQIKYTCSEDLATIKSYSDKLIIADVVSRRGVSKNEQYVFVSSRISERFYFTTAGTALYYVEDGDPLPVEYIVSDTVADLIAQQGAATITVGPNEIAYGDINGAITSDPLHVINAGNVGFGTTTPLSRVDSVVGAGATAGTFTGTTGVALEAKIAAGGGTSGTIFRALMASGNNCFNIGANGFIGINETNPIYQLQIRIPSNNVGTMLTDTIVSLAQAIYSNKGLIGTTSPHAVSLVTGGTERLTALSNGNVGVGNTSPGAKFEVNGIDSLSTSFGYRFNNNTFPLMRGRNDGYNIFHANSVALGNADLLVSEWVPYIDEVGSKFIIKVKYSTGVVKTVTLPLI